MPTMKDLVDGAGEEWGDPQENVGHLVPFGHQVLDQALTGIPIDRGSIFLVQGIKGSRKTTFVLNMIVNQCLSGRLPQGYHIAYDTLESGMTVERIRDIIWGMVATKYLIYWHWTETRETDLVRLLGRGLPTLPIVSLVNNVNCGNGRETVIRPEFFRYGMRTERQHAAIQMAGNVIRNWPILLFGASEHPDAAVRQKRTTPTWLLGPSMERWMKLQEHNVRQLAIDHMNAYRFTDNPTDFELQKRVTDAVASWQKATLGIAWVVGQVGVTSAREYRRDGQDPSSMGGYVMEAESSLTWTLIYDQDDPYFLKLKRPNKSRIGMHPDLAIKLEPNSGAFIGQAVLWGDREL